jgi:hypothetical protein
MEVPVEEVSALPLIEKATQWTRWQCIPRRATTSGANTMTTYHPGMQAKTLTHMGQFLFDSRSTLSGSVDESSRGSAVHWQSDTKRKLSAILGHVVYPRLPRPSPVAQIQSKVYLTAGKQEAKRQKAFANALQLRRTFITSLPEVLGRFEGVDTKAFAKQLIQNELRVRLQPLKLVSSSRQDLSDLPDIELHIGINPEFESPKLIDARLLLETRDCDLLLPIETADIKFRAITYHHASPRLDPAISHFLAASNFDPRSGNHPKTPQKLQLSVPGFAIVSPPLPKATPNEVGDPATSFIPGSGTDVTAEYFVMGLEHHARMMLNYEGFQLTYSTIEAGKAGGRRSELKIETREETVGRGRESATDDQFDDYDMHMGLFLPLNSAARAFIAEMRAGAQWSNVTVAAGEA